MSAGPDDAPARALAGRLRLLARRRPGPALAAARALASVLLPLRRSAWPEVAWRSSRLTNTGTPVELAWSSRDPALRWSAEACAPEHPDVARVAAASAWLAARSEIPAAPPGLPGETRPARWGAWVGGRHDHDGDRYKLYLEVRDEAPVPGLLPAPLRAALPRGVGWPMLGLESGGGLEAYGRLQSPTVAQAERLAAAAGLDPAPWLRLARALWPRGRDLLPGTTGLTIKLQGGRVLALGCFAHTGPLLGGEAAIRRRLLALIEQAGWDAEGYRELAEPLPGVEEIRPRHGMLGLGVAADGRGWLQVGLRP
jgi:hypothetical protein